MMCRKETFFKLCIIITSLIIFLGSFELILRTGIFDGTESNSPVWLPAKYKKKDQQIHFRNYLHSQLNTFGFTDKNHSIVKEPGFLRIAILGDSFIWGSGMPFEKTWNHKLEKKIAEKYQNVEVLHWGQNGWSTLNEFEFLKQEGIRFDPDLLLVGFVDNDPDMGKFVQKNLVWQQAQILHFFRKFFPNVLDFISDHVNNIISTRFLPEYYYNHWLERQYLPENLAEYGQLLKEFGRYCKDKKLRVVFVLTPNYPIPSIREEFNLVIPLLQDAGLSFLDLFPIVEEKLSGISHRKLWANPVNGHPSEATTQLFANEVYQFLEKEKILQ